MTSDASRTYRTTAFAALASVTPRALRHYDRLGLLKPRRSPAGYRLYTERDLETLEEIVALKFIGVPLKDIDAIAAAEASLRAGATLDAQLIKRLIEVMHMDQDREDTVATYTALLRAKAACLSSLSAEQRAAMRQQWTTLIDDVRKALGEDPASPQAQALLDRWIALLQELRGPLPDG